MQALNELNEIIQNTFELESLEVINKHIEIIEETIRELLEEKWERYYLEERDIMMING